MIYIFNGMEFSLRPQSFVEFLQNNNHQAVNKMKIILHLVRHKLTKWFSDNQQSYNIYIYVCIYATFQGRSAAVSTFTIFSQQYLRSGVG